MEPEHEITTGTDGAETGAATETGDEPRSGIDALNEALDGPEKTGDANESGSGDDDDDPASGQDEADATTGGDKAGEASTAAEDPSGSQGDGKDGSGARGEEADKDPTGKKQPDFVNDPLPDELKGKTRERMEGLVRIAKEKDDVARTAVERHNQLVETIRDTGATPEQFGRMLETLKLLNSGSAEEKKRGLALLREDADAIAVMLGEDTGDPRLLERHADLKSAVETGEITEKHARELAIRREQENRGRESRQQQEERHRQAQAELERGRADLDALEAELKADPDYARKRAILVEQLKPVFARIPPSQWATRFAAEYAKLRLPPAAAGTGKSGEGAQPLRAQQPAGGAKRQPKTGLEAVNFALDELSQRSQQ